MKVWALTKEYSEGKYLVVRRDGTIPEWPHFVIGASDPCAFDALMAYAKAAEREGFDPEYCESVRQLAMGFAQWRDAWGGKADPDAGPHRTDDPGAIEAMRNGGHIRDHIK